MAGEPLLRGVSFKLERRDRLTIAGRNGAGKTTLLRMLSGETASTAASSSSRRACASPCTTSARRASATLTLRDYVLSGCREPLELEEELGRLEPAMARGDEAASSPLRRRLRRASRPPAATAGASARRHLPARPRLRRRRPRPPARTFSGGQLTRALAGPRARRRARPAAPRRADQPPRHRVARVARADAARRSTRAIVLVAHDRWFLEAVGTAVLELEAGRSRFFNGTWHHWRRSRPRARWRSARRSRSSRPRSRAWSGSSSASATRRRRRARPSRASEEARQDGAHHARPARTSARSPSPSSQPERTGRVIFELEDGRLEVAGRELLLDDAEIWLERGEHVSLVGPNGTGKTTLIEALVGHRALDGGKLRTATTSSSATSASTPRSSARAARARCSRRARKRTGPPAEPGALAARAVPVQRRGGREAARRPQRRRAQAAVAGDPRVARARTS